MIQFAKKTGDYSVLSHADLLVLALTYELDQKAKQELVKEKVMLSKSLIPTKLNDQSYPSVKMKLQTHYQETKSSTSYPNN